MANALLNHLPRNSNWNYAESRIFKQSLWKKTMPLHIIDQQSDDKILQQQE